MNANAQRIAIGTGIHTAEWLVSTRAGQDLLAAAHRTEPRPRCMCVVRGVEMYVGRRGRHFYLARMPGSGLLHADDCDSLEHSGLLSGAHAYAPGAVVEDAQGRLCLAANLNRLERQPPPLTEVSIAGLLDVLVEQADLNRLAPGEAERSWLSIRARLVGAAESILVEDRVLADDLFIPTRYDRTRGIELLTDCQAFIARHDRALLCAPLKEVRATQYGWQLVLKHLPGLRLWIAAELAQTLAIRHEYDALAVPPPFALCLVAVRPGRRDGNYTVTNLASLRTDRHYFPSGSEQQDAVATELLTKGFSLLRPLRFDSPPDAALADFAILHDSGPEPVFVLNQTPDDPRRALVAVMQRNHGRMRVFLEPDA